MTVIAICGALLIVLALLYGAAPRIAAVLEQPPGRHRATGRQTRAGVRRLKEGSQ